MYLRGQTKNIQPYDIERIKKQISDWRQLGVALSSDELFTRISNRVVAKISEELYDSVCLFLVLFSGENFEEISNQTTVV